MSKWLDVQGEIVQRIHNPKGQTQNGHEVTTNFLVIKWVSEYQGEEYIDYMPIEVKKWQNQPDKIADVRVGYFVKVGLTYKCYSKNDEIKIKTNTMNGVANKFPMLFPKFELKTIEVLKANDKEEILGTNKDFESDIVDDDPDLPF